MSKRNKLKRLIEVLFSNETPAEREALDALEKIEKIKEKLNEKLCQREEI
jgi:hypothetical protein